MSIKDTPRWVTNSDAALEDAVHAGHASVEDAERAQRRRLRAASTVHIYRDGAVITAEVIEGHGRFALEKAIEAAGAAQGWRFQGSEGDGGERSVWWLDVEDPTPALRAAAESIRAMGPALVIIGRDEEAVVEYA